MIFVLLAIFMPVSKCLPKMCIKNVLFGHILFKLLNTKSKLKSKSKSNSDTDSDTDTAAIMYIIYCAALLCCWCCVCELYNRFELVRRLI